MKRILIRTAAILCAVFLLTISAASADHSNSMKEDGFSTSYSYIYDYWRDVQISPDPYRVLTVVDTSSIGLENLDNIRIKTPEGIFCRNNNIYIADTGNNRIIQLSYKNQEVSFTRVITGFEGTEPSGFKNPTDIFVDKDDNIYVADKDNHRVVMADKNLQVIKTFVKPNDNTFSGDFLPNKIAVDVAGRLYVLATNVLEGFMKYESDTVFSGYIGANAVKVDMATYIWKRYFMTKAQRAASESFVPTEYENMYMDEKGFIYATNTHFREYELMSDSAKPIRRLNGIGNDILIKNDRFPPIGDLRWKESGQQYGPSKLSDITAMDNEIYVALDKMRGRLFGYDSQGVMLWAFGTTGNADGTFTANGAIGLDHIGYDLMVLDTLKGSVTIFIPTEYGQLIYDATDAYQKGDYDGSADLWTEVMKLNTNYPLAFRGLGRSMMRQERYKEAMDYFERAHDRDDYGRAFKQYRKQVIEKSILWIVLGLAVLLLVPLGIGRIKRMKWEVMMHEHSKVRK